MFPQTGDWFGVWGVFLAKRRGGGWGGLSLFFVVAVVILGKLTGIRGYL